MPKFELDIKGEKYEVEAESEADLPEIAETIANDKGVTKDTPEQTAVDKKIAARDSAFKDIGGKIQRAAMPSGEAEGGIVRKAVGATGIDIGEEASTKIGQAIGQVPAIQAAKAALPIADVYGQLSESPIAGAVLGLKRGGLKGAKEGFLKGVSGEERVEFGDWYREMGMNEATSATLGFATSIALDPTAIKQMFTKGAYKNADKFFRNIARRGAKNQVRTVGGKKVAKRSVQQLTSDLKLGVQKKYDDALNSLKKPGETFSKYQKALHDKEASLSAMLDADKISLKASLLKERNPRKIQKTVGEFFKRNGDIYTERIDDISDAMSKSGKGLSMDDMGEAIERALMNAEEQGLAEDKIYRQLNKIKEKYLGKLDKSDNLIPPTRDIKFKEMFSDYKMIRNSGGRQNPVVGIFSNEWVDAGSKAGINEFKLLQKQYSPVMEMKTYSKKLFNLFDNKFDTKSLDTFVDRAAKGKLSSGERELLSSLKKSNPGFTDGIDLLISNSAEVAQQTGAKRAATAKTLEGVSMQKNLLESVMEKKSAEIAKGKFQLATEKASRLKDIDRRARVGTAMMKQSAKFTSNANRIKNIGSSILAYELITRPVRGMIFKAERN